MTFPTIHVNFQMSISHKYIKNDISESTCIEVAVCFPLNTYLVCHSLNKLGRRRHRVYTFQGNQLMNLNVHAISQLSSRGIPCHISNSWPVHSLHGNYGCFCFHTGVLQMMQTRIAALQSAVERYITPLKALKLSEHLKGGAWLIDIRKCLCNLCTKKEVPICQILCTSILFIHFSLFPFSG